MLDAVLELSHVLSAQGKLDEAEGVVRTALGARREAHGADDEKTRGALRELAALVGSRKKDSRAAVPLLRALHGSRHPHTLSALGSAAQRLHAQGRTSEAEAFARELVNACRDALGGDHPMTRLAGASRSRGSPTSASPARRPTRSGRRRGGRAIAAKMYQLWDGCIVWRGGAPCILNSAKRLCT